MRKTNTRSRIVSILLVLMMLLTMVPITAVTAFAASYAEISVNDILLEDNYYLKSNSATSSNYSNTEPSSYVAWYKNGVLTLKGYNGKGIETQGVAAGELTVKLIGSNSINNGALQSDNGGDITVTSDSSGTLSISKTTSGSNPAIGIETGLSGSYKTGNVTIKGNAKVTINVTHNGTSTYERAYGIYAKKNITISESASVDITCATPYNTTGGGNCNGLYAAQNVIIDTNGTIKIDVTKAGKDDGYSFGVYPMGTATLTKVGEMEVQWKKHATHSSFPGGAVYKGASLSDTDYAINVDEINCYASYRFGTPRNVTVQDGQLTGPGVKYANGSGYFLAGDKVNITPATKKGRSGEEIPFKEWTSSDVMLDKSATTASNSFTVPGKDVTVTAKHSPFVGTPTFTPTGTTGTEGTLTFKTVVKADAAYEGFRLVKEGNENNESSYNLINPDTTSTSSPYEYSYKTNIYELNNGNYYVVAYLKNHYYLSEKFTVNYTAPVTTYTVSFNANGGTGTMADVTGVSGEYTLPANGFTAPAGKQFKAWSVGGVEKAAGDTITVNANTTVTAIWENIPVVTYTVSFAANGGTGTMADVTGISGEYTLPENGFTAPAGKQFKTWSVGGVEKAVGDKITVTANTTVTAVWEDIPVVTYTVSFDANGGTGSMADVTGVSGEYTLPANGFTAPDGKQFKAWSVGGVEKAAGDTITVNANTTVTAIWEPIPVTTYTVSFDANGGSGSMADVTNISGSYTLPACTFTAPSDKQFKGWATSADGSVISGTTYEVSSDTIFYAIWESKEYSITVTDGKATIGAGSEISKAAEGTAVTLTANAAPSGKVFDKWEVVSGGITLADANSATTTFTMPAEAVSVKATYKNAPHTHTYNQETVKPEALKTPADCTNNAVYFKSCSCGAISTTDTFAAMGTALGHTWIWVVDQEAALNQPGKQHEECTGCHAKRSENTEIPALRDYAYGVYVGMTYTAGNLIYRITSIDTATLGQSKVIGVVAAKKNKIKKVTIPDRADCKGYRLNVTTIGNNAFAGCKALKKLTIGNKVTVIGKNAFKKCSKLETVVIGKAVKTISSKAFIGDNKIKKITFKGKKLKTVNKNAFSKKVKKNIKSKKTKLKGNKKAIKLFKKKLKIK